MNTLVRVLVLVAVAGIGIMLARGRIELELSGDAAPSRRRRWLVVVLAYLPVAFLLYAAWHLVAAIH
jgi:hypothetical protein